MTIRYDVIVHSRCELANLPGLSFEELCRLCESQTQVIRRLVDIGLVEPIGSGPEPRFATAAVIRVRKALRLKRDLQLNLNALALVMELLDRIDELERGHRR